MDISPPTPAELQAQPFLFNEANKPVLDGTGPGVFGFPRKTWILAAVAAGLVALTIVVLKMKPEGLSGPLVAFGVLGFLGFMTSLVLLPPLVFVTLKRRRYRRLGRVLRGAAQCMEVSYGSSDDSGAMAMFHLTFRYVFATPEGATLGGVTSQMVEGDGLRWMTSKEIVYERWPKIGGRIPIAILFVSPRTYEIL